MLVEMRYHFVAINGDESLLAALDLQVVHKDDNSCIENGTISRLVLYTKFFEDLTIDGISLSVSVGRDLNSLWQRLALNHTILIDDIDVIWSRFTFAKTL